MKPSPALSIQKNMKPTLAGRVVGVLIADGSDPDAISAMQKAVSKQGGKCMIVAPRLSGLKIKGEKEFKADGQLLGTPSQLFDAVAIILSADGCEQLMKEGAAVQFAMDAFGHLKRSVRMKMPSPCLIKPA